MRLPWDSKYLKISFHVIFTLSIVVILWFLMLNIIPILRFIFNILGKTFSILSPLWIGIVIAYLLDPLAEYFQKKYEKLMDKNQLKINSFKKKIGIKDNREEIKYKTRGAGAIISYLLIIVLIIILGIFISSSLEATGNSSNMNNLVNYINQTLNNFNIFLNNIQLMLSKFKLFEQTELINNIINKTTSLTENLSNQIINGISKAGIYIINFAIGIVVGFYFIKDKIMIISKTIEFSEAFIPRKINSIIKTLISDINAVFSGYIRGQLTDAVIMASMIAVSLTIIGIDFAVIIGIISGFSNLIPFIGAFVGLALTVVVGLLSGTPMKTLLAVIAILLLQQVDNAIIIPKIVGHQVDLHPVLVVLALSVGGTIFGLWGLIFAVPITAIIKIFLIRYMQRRKQLKK